MKTKSLRTSSFFIYTPVYETKAQQPRDLYTHDCLRSSLVRREKGYRSPDGRCARQDSTRVRKKKAEIVN